MFDVSHYIRQRVSRANSNEQVNMVSGPADAFGDASHCSYRTAKKRVETFAPIVGNKRLSMLGREDNVYVKTEVCGRHWVSGAHAGARRFYIMPLSPWALPTANVLPFCPRLTAH